MSLVCLAARMFSLGGDDVKPGHDVKPRQQRKVFFGPIYR
jgi:hypothetical protein